MAVTFFVTLKGESLAASSGHNAFSMVIWPVCMAQATIDVCDRDCDAPTDSFRHVIILYARMRLLTATGFVIHHLTFE